MRTATTPEDFLSWLAEPEGTRLEFKEAKTRFDLEKLLKYCVALANEGGGKILLGVTDRRPRTVVGSNAFDEPGRTEAVLHQRLGHRIPVEEMFIDGRRVVIVHVPSRFPGTPWQYDGRYLKRAGDELTAMRPDELRAIFDEVGPDFSAQVCPDASIHDLSPAAIATFRTRWARRTGDERRHAWTDEQTLADAELTVDGIPTYAALILFGTRAALGRHLAQAEVVFEYRSSEASGPAADREEYREGFFLWSEALWTKINLRNDKQSLQHGLFRVEIPTFDEVSVREALLNAVAHRDYRLISSVFVRQFVRRLVIESPGGLPNGVTPENILDQQFPRNRRLAEALARCGLIERSGQGMNLMYESAIKHGKALPSFDGTTPDLVRLTISGTLNSPEFVHFIEQLGAERTRHFSTQDFLVLDILRRGEDVPANLRSAIPGLLSAGAIESVGRGRGTRFILSKALYAALNGKGTYTRQKGLDRETNKALLMKHIRDNAGTGSKMEEFLQVLPTLTRKQVGSLLREMRKDGLVHSVGATSAARWFPGPQLRSTTDAHEKP